MLVRIFKVIKLIYLNSKSMIQKKKCQCYCQFYDVIIATCKNTRVKTIRFNCSVPYSLYYRLFSKNQMMPFMLDFLFI